MKPDRVYKLTHRMHLCLSLFFPQVCEMLNYLDLLARIHCIFFHFVYQACQTNNNEGLVYHLQQPQFCYIQDYRVIQNLLHILLEYLPRFVQLHHHKSSPFDLKIQDVLLFFQEHGTCIYFSYGIPVFSFHP